DLKIDFLAPVLDQIVIVTGKRVKAGKTIFLAEARMFNEKGSLVAHGTSKLMTVNNKQTMSDVVDYVSAEKLPSKFVKERHAI
ncbi:MAG: PaaI family thioesterase, partial [Desulfovibrionales bacterium]|nr:PaaI family thioesterase [Desulfovibrionales bacterium]